MQLGHRKQGRLNKLNGILGQTLYRRYMHEAKMPVQTYPSWRVFFAQLKILYFSNFKPTNRTSSPSLIKSRIDF